MFLPVPLIVNEDCQRVVAQFEIFDKCGVIPKPRVSTSGARNLSGNGRYAGRSFAPPEKRLH